MAAGRGGLHSVPDGISDSPGSGLRGQHPYAGSGDGLPPDQQGDLVRPGVSDVGRPLHDRADGRGHADHLQLQDFREGVSGHAGPGRDFRECAGELGRRDFGDLSGISVESQPGLCGAGHPEGQVRGILCALAGCGRRNYDLENYPYHAHAGADWGRHFRGYGSKRTSGRKWAPAIKCG